MAALEACLPCSGEVKHEWCTVPGLESSWPCRGRVYPASRDAIVQESGDARRAQLQSQLRELFALLESGAQGDGILGRSRAMDAGLVRAAGAAEFRPAWRGTDHSPEAAGVPGAGTAVLAERPATLDHQWLLPAPAPDFA